MDENCWSQICIIDIAIGCLREGEGEREKESGSRNSVVADEQFKIDCFQIFEFHIGELCVQSDQYHHLLENQTKSIPSGSIENASA